MARERWNVGTNNGESGKIPYSVNSPVQSRAGGCMQGNVWNKFTLMDFQ